MADCEQISPDDSYFDDLRKHRATTLELRADQLRVFDKSILAVSSGALGLSIAFLDKLGGSNPTATGFLISAWLLFAGAIVLNIVSYLTGAKDAYREVEKIDQCLVKQMVYETGGNLFRGVTENLNVAALSLFVAGVLCLAAYAYNNISDASHGPIKVIATPITATSP